MSSYYEPGPIRKQRINSYHTRKHMGLMGAANTKPKQKKINLNSDLINDHEYE